MVIPEGIRNPLSINTKTPGRLCILTNSYSSNCDRTLRVTFRALASKMPGMFFSAYQQVVFLAGGLISKEQYQEIINHYAAKSEESQHRLREILDQYKSNDDIPKSNLFVKLSPDITKVERQYLANGLRAYLGDLTFLIDVAEREESINTSLFLF